MTQKISDNLTKIKNSTLALFEAKKKGLPQDFNQTRFLQNAMMVLTTHPAINQFPALDFARALLKGAFMGLDFFSNECYAIPRKGKLQFEIDYRGMVKLAKIHSLRSVLDIYAKLIRKEDLYYRKTINGIQQMTFEPIPLSSNPIIGAFAVIIFKDGGILIEDMNIEEIDFIKKKNPYSEAWKTSYGEMAKKTVIRRIFKSIQLQFDNSEQYKIWQEAAEMEYDKKPEPQQAASSLDLENQILQQKNQEEEIKKMGEIN